MNGRLSVLICVLAASTAAVGASDSMRLDFDFTLSDHGFSAGFSDYPQGADPSLYSLTNAWMAGPANLGGKPALFISGVNRSDDLFMFWKKQITGLPTNRSFLLTMELELASKYAEGLVGVGGAPGEGVTVKAGAVTSEPQPFVDRIEGWWRMNLDKGNQAIGGTNMFAIGKIAKPPDGNVDYVFLTRHHHGQPLAVTTSNEGSIWLIFGTDSGFEGQTALFYSKLMVWMNRADQPAIWIENTSPPEAMRLIWNEGDLHTATLLHSDWPPISNPTRPYTYDPQIDPVRFWRISQRDREN